MSNCKEFLLDDMMAITAIPVANIPASNLSSLVNSLTPAVAKSAFNIGMLNGAVVIGRQAPSGATGVTLVPIRRLTGKAKDDPSDSVSGRLHTVTASCEVDERGGEIWASVNGTPCSFLLERTPHHLLLTFRDGSQGFAAADRDSYFCSVERDGAKVTVNFRIQNLMGIQMLV